MSMAGLRRGAAQVSGNKGGSKRPIYAVRWKPPAMTANMMQFLTPDETRGLQIAEPVVFITSAYPDVYQTTDDNGQPLQEPVLNPAYRFKSHTIPTIVKGTNGRPGWKKFAELVCSAGLNPHSPQPCVGCYISDHGEDGTQSKDQWAFNVAHLAWYHETPVIKNGQVQMKKDNSGPLTNKVECITHKQANIVFGRMDQMNRGQPMAKTCEGCANQYKFVWGDHRVLQVGKGQLMNILACNDKLGERCYYCDQAIVTWAYTCSNMACRAGLLHIQQSGQTNAQIDQFSKRAIQCGTCGTVGLPKPAYSCQCAAGTDPRPLDMFDVVMWAQRDGEGTKTAFSARSSTIIEDYIMPDGVSLSGYPDNRPLEEALKDIVKSPFDLRQMFAPKTLDEQAKEIDRANPYAQQQGGYQPYPGQPPVQGTGYAPPQAGYNPQQGFQQPPQVPPGYTPNQQSTSGYVPQGGPVINYGR